MIITADDIIAEARKLIGTRFVHQGRDPRLGFDCVGALVCVADALGVAHSDDKTYALRPNRRGVMRRIMIDSGCVQRESIDLDRHGDILTFWYAARGVEYHAGFLATDRGRPTVVHALPGKGMVEHGINDFWRDRLVGQFRPPGITEEVPT